VDTSTVYTDYAFSEIRNMKKLELKAPPLTLQAGFFVEQE
jgi:hypothetical protein